MNRPESPRPGNTSFGALGWSGGPNRRGKPRKLRP